MTSPLRHYRKFLARPARERGEKPAPRRAEKQPSAAPESPPVVLIVDDNADVRAAYRFMLEDEFTVLEAPDADVALKRMTAEKIDVLLTDLFMDGSIDGVGLVHIVRDQPSRPAIIAMSGLPHVAYRPSLEAARTLGADATLTKPFTRVELLRTIRSLIGGGPAINDPS